MEAIELLQPDSDQQWLLNGDCDTIDSSNSTSTGRAAMIKATTHLNCCVLQC